MNRGIIILIISCFCLLGFEPIFSANVNNSPNNFESIEKNEKPEKEPKKKKKKRWLAIVLALTLGIFGVHRLYLGTAPIVPAAYTFTLGGGFFVLPIIDIIHIFTVKSLSQLENVKSVFIWNKKQEEN